MMEDASYFHPKIRIDKTLINVAVGIKLFSQSKRSEFLCFLQTFDQTPFQGTARLKEVRCASVLSLCMIIELKPKKVKYTTVYPKLWVT